MIKKLGEDNLIVVNNHFISGMFFDGIEIEQMKTLLLCLKDMKILVPKYLKMMIFNEKEIFLFFDDYFCKMKDKELINKKEFEKKIINAKIFDEEKKSFFVISEEQKNDCLKVKKTFLFLFLLFSFILNFIFIFIFNFFKF